MLVKLCVLALLRFRCVCSAGDDPDGVDAIFCRIQKLSRLSGSFGGHGNQLQSEAMYGDCAWHIDPGYQLQVIEFTSNGDSFFEGSDKLDVYGSSHAEASTRVATFNRNNPMPKSMALTGSDAPLFVLSASSNATHFSIDYSCRPIGARVGGLWLSPVGYVCVLAAFVILGVASLLLPVYFVCYIRARSLQERSLQESQLMLRSQLARRLRDSELARSQEQIVLARLQALPTERWKDHEASGNAECCLCLEEFNEEDMVRVLPCGHFFHEACVDSWFAAKRFMPRSCPLCKKNPLAGTTSPPAQLAVLPENLEPEVEAVQRFPRPPASEAHTEAANAPDPMDPEVGEVVHVPDGTRTAAAERSVLGRPMQAWDA